VTSERRMLNGAAFGIRPAYHGNYTVIILS
jgi:hypothetical protein